MADLTYYAAKIAECLRLLESSNDPLYRNVYQAMADEFADKYAALQHGTAGEHAPVAPPSELLHQVTPPPARPKPSRAHDSAGKSGASSRSARHARRAEGLADEPPDDRSALTLKRV
jgi:hypothetical protein